MSINPFTPNNIIKNIRVHLDKEDDKDFIIYLDKLKNRLFHAAHQIKDNIFWGHTARTKGLQEIYNMFLTSEHKKFEELDKIWKEVSERYNKHGFKY